MISQNIKNNLRFLFTILFVYIILFEFIIPPNKFIPQPTILWESIIHLWTIYNFGLALISTATIVYISIMISFLWVIYFRGLIIKYLVTYKKSFEVFRIFRYFPAFFFAILFAVWFKSSLTAEIIFGFLVSLILILLKMNELIPEVKSEFIIFTHQTNPRKMFSETYWKSILPKLFQHLYRIQIYLWTLILIYEFISESIDVGLVYKNALSYNDLGAIISISIFMSIVVWLSNIILKYVEKKMIYWE